MNKLLWFIGSMLIILFCSQIVVAGPFEKGPVKEPKVKSPLVIKNSKGKVVFGEFFRELRPVYKPYYLGNEITGFKLYDPSTDEVILDVEMKNGRLISEIGGTAKNEAIITKVPGETAVFEEYVSADRAIIFNMGRDGDNIGGYFVVEDVGERTRRLMRNVGLVDGRIRTMSGDLYDKNRRWKNRDRNTKGHYVETVYPSKGGYQKKIFKEGFLSEQMTEGPDYAGNAKYHQGKLAFWTKQTKEEARKGLFRVYDENDNLVDTVKMAFGEYYEIRFEDRKGKPAKIFRKTRGKKIVNEVIREIK